MTSWIEAVAKWRAGGGKGSIPSKGSADYLKIKGMMGGSAGVKEGYEKIVRPTKKGAARVGGKGNAKFMEKMDEEFFTGPEIKKLATSMDITRKDPKLKKVNKAQAEKLEQLASGMSTSYLKKLVKTLYPKKATAKEKKTKAVADMAADVGFGEFKATQKSRKPRSDKGKKRVKKE
jgi:hypothetical protein